MVSNGRRRILITRRCSIVQSICADIIYCLYTHTHTHTHTHTLAWWVGCSPKVRETWVQSQVTSYQRLLKWYLIPPCLTLSNIRYVSRVKWSNSGKGVAPSLTSRCSSYWKENLLVALNNGRQLYLLYLPKEKWKLNKTLIVNIIVPLAFDVCCSLKCIFWSDVKLRGHISFNLLLILKSHY